MSLQQKYKRGLVIGKFLPPHKGHVALIEFAAAQCEQLEVMVCSLPSEPIPGHLRLQWMKRIFSGSPHIRFRHITEELPQDKEPSRNASKVWSEYLTQHFGRFDVIFSSEKYGDFMAEYLPAVHVPFDYLRQKFPISGTNIRKHPARHWDFIPDEVKPYFVKKICLYGPESTGKTILAQQLAEHYQTVWVPEFARGHMAAQGDTFSYEDMEIVGRGQHETEKKARLQANRVLFCDTDALTTLIYSRHYFQKIPQYVQERADNRAEYDLHLLLDIDLPWEADPLRDLGHRRQEMYDLFLAELTKRGYPHEKVSGMGKQRLQSAVKIIDALL